MQALWLLLLLLLLLRRLRRLLGERCRFAAGAVGPHVMVR
jgi:hypothetical protein